jgi:DNA-binding MarR family transcriptional regulator
MTERERQVRALAQRVAFAAQGTARGAESLAEARKTCLRAAPDIDPDALDRAAPEYLAGAIDALTGVLASLEEQTLPASTVRLLMKSERARILCAVIAHRGLNQKQLAARLGIKESNLAGYLRELSAASLLEPSPADGLRGRSYAPSSWGRLAWSRLLDGSLGIALPRDELAAAVAASAGGDRPAAARVRAGAKPAVLALRDPAAGPKKRK